MGGFSSARRIATVRLLANLETWGRRMAGDDTVYRKFALLSLTGGA